MAFPWIDERIAQLPDRKENLGARIGHPPRGAEPEGGIAHGVPSRPAEAFADFNLRERKHYACGDAGDRAAPRAKGSSLGAGLDPLDDGTGASRVFGDRVMHIARGGAPADGGQPPRDGTNLLGQRADASMRSTAPAADDGSFSVRKWRRSKKMVDPAYGQGQASSVRQQHGSGIVLGSSRADRGDHASVQIEGTFRSGGHIVGYQGHISRANPESTRASPQGRATWNKDLLVANHRERVAGYAGFRK